MEEVWSIEVAVKAVLDLLRNRLKSQNSNLLMNPIAKVFMKVVFSCKKVILHQV